MIHSPQFPGARRRWQLSLVTRTPDDLELDVLPLYLTVIDPMSLMVCCNFLYFKFLLQSVVIYDQYII